MSRAKKVPVRACRFCGCTDDRACAEGCSWLYHEVDVCTECMIELLPAITSMRQVLVRLGKKNRRGQ